MRTRVVNLGAVRDLLGELDKVRTAILAGKVTGFQCTLMDSEDTETIYMGGPYREDPKLALSAILKASAARVMTEDPPPALKVAS